MLPRSERTGLIQLPASAMPTQQARGLTDIDDIGSDQDWDSGDFDAEDALCIWGPELPNDFVVIHEAGG